MVECVCHVDSYVCGFFTEAVGVTCLSMLGRNKVCVLCSLPGLVSIKKCQQLGSSKIALSRAQPWLARVNSGQKYFKLVSRFAACPWGDLELRSSSSTCINNKSQCGQPQHTQLGSEASAVLGRKMRKLQKWWKSNASSISEGADIVIELTVDEEVRQLIVHGVC